MNKDNVLILIEAMVPFTNYWGGCQRAYMFGQKLIESGYKVHVICRNQSQNDEGIVEHNGMIVCGRGRPITSQSDNVGSMDLSIKRRVKNFVKNNSQLKKMAMDFSRFLYSEPNVFDGRMSANWVKDNINYIKDYIRDNKIGLVIISGPPFGLFRIASILKKSVKVVLDYRDPWTLWYEKVSLASIFEKRALKNADLIITSTNALADSIKSHFEVENVYPILNGYNKKMWESLDPFVNQEKHFVISHIGLITLNREGGFRNATNFIKAVDAFLSNHEDAIAQFVGVKNPEEGYQLGLNNRLFFLPQVPVERSLEMIRESNVLVALHTAEDSSGKYIICGKIYDYLMSGNYILSIGDYAYANCEMVMSNKAGIHCKNDVKEILAALNLLYQKWKGGSAEICHRDTDQYSRDYQNTQFLRLVEAITE